MANIKCAECEFCRKIHPLGYKRAEYICMHPDQSYIIDYFKKKEMLKMPGFLAFGPPDEVPLKTSPAWCPRKLGKK